ncbi:MAG TPA: hypothetical protein VLD62_09235 [Acidimicrobiia bacterium]|nr:hypothetical protein [Acidimicrobiia bacterium]
MVVVARFLEEARARRMRGWLRLCHIPARLRRGDDGRIELWVRRDDEARALDFLCTIVVGLDVGHLPPSSRRERMLEGENLLVGAVFGFVGLMAGIVAVIAVPVLLALGLVVPVVTAACGFAAGVVSGTARDTEWHTGGATALPAWAAEISTEPPRR